MSPGESLGHFGDEGEFIADSLKIAGRLDLACGILTKGGRGIFREDLPDLVELQQIECMSVHRRFGRVARAFENEGETGQMVRIELYYTIGSLN